MNVKELLDRAVCPGPLGGYERARDVLARGEVERVIEATANIAAVDVIRSLGFIGGSHYCPGCMREFHEALGQHEPGCPSLADLRRLQDEEDADES